MALVLTKAARVDIARSFRRDLVNTKDYFYIAVGKTTPWLDSNGAEIEEAPPNPIDTTYDTNVFRRDIMLVQKLDSADIVHLARRINWESGTVYDQYDDSYGRKYVDVWGQAASDGSTLHSATSGATNLADSNFYVMTNEFKVYKCLKNGNGAASTIKPTITDPSIIEILDDGYHWKFLFTVSASDQNKFLDSQYIPVRKLTGNPEFDVNGEIDSITVTAGGSGYTSTPTVTITGDGDITTGNVPLATATVTAGAVSSISVDRAGSGFSFARVTISGGGGSGAAATASLGDADSLPALGSAVEGNATRGTIDRIDVTKVGSDYVSGDTTVVITGDGSGAEATAVVDANTGQITAINVTDNGSGYSFADITFVNSLGAEKTGAAKATARAVISPPLGHGSHPVKELYAHRLALVVSLDDNTNTDLFVDNDFRQVALMKNLLKYNWTDAGTDGFTANTGKTSHRIEVGTLTAYNNYEADDIITTNDNGKFRVIQKQIDGSNYYIWLQPIIDIISSSSTLTNTGTTANPKNITGLSINTYSSSSGSEDLPDVDVHTGEILYVENRAKINRQEEQVETIKAILTF